MAKIKASEASGAVLNWLVAKCVANVVKDATLNGVPLHGWWVAGLYADPNAWVKLEHWLPSTKWSQGGPIKSANRISSLCYFDSFHERDRWFSTLGGAGAYPQRGDTELEAAMRCLVASKLGDEVEVPDELTQN